MMRRLVLAGALLAAPCAAQAAPWQAEFGAGRESLGNGLGDWQQVDLALRRQLAPRSQFELNARATERFGLRDNELGVGMATPLAGAWDATLAITASSTHRVLARWSLAAGLQRPLGDGWLVGAAIKFSHYDSDRVSALSLNAERYFGSSAVGEWRAAATVTATRLAGLGSSGAARLQIDRYFGERARLGVLVAGGRETENLGQGALRVADVQSVVVLGRWPLGAAWAVTGEVGRHRVGATHRRSGGRLGVQLDF